MEGLRGKLGLWVYGIRCDTTGAWQGKAQPKKWLMFTNRAPPRQTPEMFGVTHACVEGAYVCHLAQALISVHGPCQTSLDNQVKCPTEPNPIIQERSGGHGAQHIKLFKLAKPDSNFISLLSPPAI